MSCLGTLISWLEVDLSFCPAALMEIRLFLSFLSLSVSLLGVVSFVSKSEYDESGSPVLRYGLEDLFLSLQRASTTNLTVPRYGLEAFLSSERRVRRT